MFLSCYVVFLGKCLIIGSPISCLDIYNRASAQYSDGEYDIWIRGKLMKVYCSGMQLGQPREYITKRSGPLENYFETYNKR